MADKEVLDLPADFDQLLRQELSVEPSAAFAARVRARVTGPQYAPWWRARWIPAIGSFATVASIALAVTLPAITRWTAAPSPPPAPAVRLPSIQHPTLSPAMEAQGTAPAPHARRSVALVNVSGLPEVIVDGRQRAALATLFRMMEQGRVSGDSFAATVPVSMEPIAEQVGAIIIAPVFVSAMPPGGVLPYENQR